MDASIVAGDARREPQPRASSEAGDRPLTLETPTRADAHADGWKPGSRVGRLRASHSYRPVLVLIVVAFVYMSYAPDVPWARFLLVVLECATLLLALWTAGLGGDYRPGLALVAICAGVAVLGLTHSGSTTDGAGWLALVFVGIAIVVVIGLGVVDQRDVNRQSVSGAICIYLLLGILFTFAYGALAAFGSGWLFAQGTDGTMSIRLYFSYVTLATLGYGDYTPAGTTGHTIAVVEALLGQLYLVTVLALLVGRLGQKHREPPGP